MYAKTYTDAGQNLWFTTTDELFDKYPCFITFTGDNKHLVVYAMFQKKKFVNNVINYANHVLFFNKYIKFLILFNFYR